MRCFQFALFTILAFLHRAHCGPIIPPDTFLPENVLTSSNQTIQFGDGKRGWVSPPDDRGTLDILWTSILTMTLCSWSILCLNVPSRDDSKWRIGFRRLALTAMCFMGPEFTLQIAVGQWVSARQSVRDFRAYRKTTKASDTKHAAIKDWTITHAFYADMGGFLLQPSDDDYPPFPVNAKQLLFLIRAGFVDYPDITKRNIEDKNKVDVLLRVLTVGQAMWFAINAIGRGAQGLPITCIELTAIAFIFCSLATMFFWRHKPADVNEAEVLLGKASVNDMIREAHREMQRGRSRAGPSEADVVIPVDYLTHAKTPLDVISRQEWFWSLYWSNWMGVLRSLGIDFGPRRRPISRFENMNATALPLGVYVPGLVFPLAYFALFFIAWDFDFPTSIERTLWRVSAVAQLAAFMCYILVTHFAFEVWPWLSIQLRPLIQRCRGQPSEGQDTRPSNPTSWFWRTANRCATSWRNNSPTKDPQLTVPFKAILPVNALATVYCFARCYILVADLIELRSLPANAFVAVRWLAFLPHLA